MQIKQLNGQNIQRVFGLIPAKPGVGKTTQATTFPIGETLIASVEDGLLSIEGSGYASVEIKSYNELITLLETITKVAPWCKYLYIDSLTEIYDVLKHELKGKYKASQNFAKHDDMIDKMLHAVRIARQLPISVFFTCHTKEDKDGMTITQNLCFDGKMPELVLKQFDLSFHLDFVDSGNGKKTRAFITDPQISKIAKGRVSPFMNVVLDSYEEPNLYKLSLKLMGKQ